MSRNQKFFRWVWRANAVLILLALVAMLIGVITIFGSELWPGGPQHGNDGASVLVAKATKDERQLELGRPEVVAGTRFLRAQLVAHLPDEGPSSGDAEETRNLLFIDPKAHSAHWLLPGHQQVLAELQDIDDPHGEAQGGHTVASLALLEPVDAAVESSGGKLVLFDPSGQHLVEVAGGVQEIATTSVSGDGLVLVYQRGQRYFVATFDPGSLARRSEQPIEIPRIP